MDLGKRTKMTEAQSIIEMVQFYRDMCPRQSHVLAPLKSVYKNPKGRAILWNENLEVAFCELRYMVSVKTLLNHHDWTIPFPVHTYASDKQLGAIISQNYKTSFFNR